MRKAPEEIRPEVQKVIRHLVKQGAMSLDDKTLIGLAGDEKIANAVKAQLEALMASDGCWCPDPPNGCKC